MPLVSVVVPAYNYGAYIGQAIESVLCQSVADLEVLVVDDGSTDDTPQVVGGFDDPRLRYLRQKNAGLSAARNAGLRQARGDYVAFLDADDLWLPQKLELQLARFERSSMVGLVYGGYYKVDERGARIAAREATIAAGDQLKRLMFGNYVTGSATTSIVRRSCFEQVGVFDERLKAAEDWDMWLRIAERYQLRAVREPVAAIRVHTRNMTADADVMDAHFQAVLDKFFGRPNLAPELAGLQSKARANARVGAAVFAMRRGQRAAAMRLARAALRHDFRHLGAYRMLLTCLLWSGR